MKKWFLVSTLFIFCFAAFSSAFAAETYKKGDTVEIEGTVKLPIISMKTVGMQVTPTKMTCEGKEISPREKVLINVMYIPKEFKDRVKKGEKVSVKAEVSTFTKNTAKRGDSVDIFKFVAWK